MGDAIAGRILKIDPQGRVLGSFTGPQPGQGPHFDPHQIALAPDGSIFTAEVLGWRAEKAPAEVARRLRGALDLPSVGGWITGYSEPTFALLQLLTGGMEAPGHAEGGLAVEAGR
jgi:hypothetical protein